MTTPTTLRRPALRRFVGHYLEIVVAAVAGMVVLGPAESMLLNPIGWAEVVPTSRPLRWSWPPT